MKYFHWNAFCLHFIMVWKLIVSGINYDISFKIFIYSYFSFKIFTHLYYIYIKNWNMYADKHLFFRINITYIGIFMLINRLFYYSFQKIIYFNKYIFYLYVFKIYIYLYFDNWYAKMNKNSIKTLSIEILTAMIFFLS